MNTNYVLLTEEQIFYNYCMEINLTTSMEMKEVRDAITDTYAFCVYRLVQRFREFLKIIWS